MPRSIRRLLIAVVFVIVFTVVGTVGGFFNVHDLINQATINVEDNEFGGKTTTKLTYEDKTVTFIKTENSLWTSTIDEVKPYWIQSYKNDSDEIVTYVYSYIVDKSLDECVAFYKELLDDETVTAETDYAVVRTEVDGYLYEASIEKKDDLNVEMYVMISKDFDE